MCEMGSIKGTPSKVCGQRRICRPDGNAMSVLFYSLFFSLFFTLRDNQPNQPKKADVHPVGRTKQQQPALTREAGSQRAETRSSSGGQGARTDSTSIEGGQIGSGPRIGSSSPLLLSKQATKRWTSGRNQWRRDDGGRQGGRGAAAGGEVAGRRPGGGSSRRRSRRPWARRRRRRPADVRPRRTRSRGDQRRIERLLGGRLESGRGAGQSSGWIGAAAGSRWIRAADGSE